MGSFNTYSNSTRSCALVNKVLSGFPIFERLISLNGALWSYAMFSTKCSSMIRQRRSKLYGAALRRDCFRTRTTSCFPLNLSRQFFNIIFVRRKTHCSFSVKYTWFVSHLSDEKTKDIYIYHIYFEIATFLKTDVYIYIYKRID